MKPIPSYIDNKDRSGLMFSVCSLVRHQDKYDRLLESFGKGGFTSENSEFLAADNRTQNQFDGYSWQKTLLAEARGRYVIFCHDDIELIDEGYEDLVARIRFLDTLDPTWLVAGIAGGLWHAGNQTPGLALHISDPLGDDRRFGQLPARVESLDECFMVMRRNRPVTSSYDLKGFHYYGPDLCLQAELAGGTAYAIDFHVRHYGAGTMGDDFKVCRRAFIRKYRQFFPNRRIRCTTGRVALKLEND